MDKETFIEQYFVDRRNSPSRKWANLNQSTIPLSVADMDFASPDCVQIGLKKVLDLRAYGYTALKEDYYEVFKDYYLRHHGVIFEKDDIFFADGAIAAINHLIDCFTKVHDKILICPPVYHQFAHIVKTTRRKLVTSPLIKKGQTFLMDYEDLEKKFKTGVKMMILCNPHNPTGHVYTKKELTKLGELALKYHVLIISDEVHADFGHGEHKHTSLMSLEELYPLSFGIVGASKTFNLALFAHSHITIKDKGLKKTFREFLNQHHLGQPKLINAMASYYAFKDGDEWLRMINAIIYDNYRLASSYFDQLGLFYAKLEGSYLMFVDLKPLLKDEKIEDFIKRWDVVPNLGAVFGDGYETFVRLNLATHPNLILEALKRLIKLKGD